MKTEKQTGIAMHIALQIRIEFHLGSKVQHTDIISAKALQKALTAMFS
jgi:hypothetical protein